MRGLPATAPGAPEPEAVPSQPSAETNFAEPTVFVEPTAVASKPAEASLGTDPPVPEEAFARADRRG